MTPLGGLSVDVEGRWSGLVLPRVPPAHVLRLSGMGAAAAGITADTVRRLPKAELHLHLDSGFEVEDAVRLAEENGVPLLKEPPEAMFDWEDLQEFLTFLDWVLCLPRNAEQVASLSYSVRPAPGPLGGSPTPT